MLSEVLKGSNKNNSFIFSIDINLLLYEIVNTNIFICININKDELWNSCGQNYPWAHAQPRN